MDARLPFVFYRRSNVETTKNHNCGGRASPDCLGSRSGLVFCGGLVGDVPAPIVPYLLTGIGSLAAAVAFLYLQQRKDTAAVLEQLRKDHDEAHSRWRQCEIEKDNMWKVIADMKGITPTQLKQDYGIAGDG